MFHLYYKSQFIQVFDFEDINVLFGLKTKCKRVEKNIKLFELKKKVKTNEKKYIYFINTCTFFYLLF